MGPGERNLKGLIVTADDFGCAPEVNAAVEAAYRDGILTATSLMIAAPAAANAVERAKTLPNLGVGLHIVVVRGKSLLPASEIPALVDQDGRFNTNLIRAGFRYFFSLQARRQLRAEIRAQFDAFLETGLTLDHVNSHNHMHLHPTVLSIILDVGGERGLRAMRLPFEPASGIGAICLKPWIWLTRRRLRRAGIRHNDVLLGMSATGHMDKDTMLRTIANLPAGIAEIMTHPATKDWTGREPEAEGFFFADELAALTDPVVRDAVERAGATRLRFAEIP